MRVIHALSHIRFIRSLILPFLAFALLGSPASADQEGFPQNAAEFLAFEKSLQNLTFDSTTQRATVDQLTITRDVGTFTLTGGEIYLAGGLGGRKYAALYEGHGEFRMDINNSIERENFKRMTGKDSVHVAFKKLIFIFTDSTAKELLSKLAFSEKSRSFREWKAIFKHLSYDDTKELNSSVLEALLNNNTDGFFYSGFDGKDGPWYFEITPFEREQVRLRRLQTYWTYAYRETLCRLPLNSFNSDALVQEQQAVTHKITAYEINSEIQENYGYLGDVTATVTSYGDAGPWLFFTLFEDMDVDAVLDDEDNNLQFVRKKDLDRIWVNVGRSFNAGEVLQLKFITRGGLIAVDLDWSYILSPTGWYPATRYIDTASFDMTFHTPTNNRFVTVGDLLSADTTGKVITSHWSSNGLYNQATFSVGRFSEYTIGEESAIPISVLFSKEMHTRMRQALATQAISVGKNMDQRVAADIANAVNFYTKVLGPCPTDSLVVTEIPFGHGQAFPGLLHLSTMTYQLGDQNGEQELFRAHEAAHQWWGLGVGTSSYHDKWISEGFSEFFALWFVQMAYGKSNVYFDRLKKWRKRILGNRKFLFGSGQEGGPVSLGYRTTTKETLGDYDLIIYQKGAWVLHMLRNMMLDYETMSDALFTELMYEFYNKYKGKEASTNDFRLLVEEFSGMDMNWFFDQWVHGTDIPKYKFAHKTEQDPDGNYLVTCRVRQEEVPAEFKMFIPIRVELEGSEFPVRLQVFITGEESMFALPPFASEPKKILLNDMESVLCEVDNEKW